MCNGGIISTEELNKMIDKMFKNHIIYSPYEQILNKEQITELAYKLKLNSNIPSMASKLYEKCKNNSNNI